MKCYSVIDPVTLIFDLWTPKSTISKVFQGHTLHQVWTLWDHSFLSYAADKQTNKQTDKQTDSKMLPTPTDIVGVGNHPEHSWVIHRPLYFQHWEESSHPANQGNITVNRYLDKTPLWTKPHTSTSLQKTQPSTSGGSRNRWWGLVGVVEAERPKAARGWGFLDLKMASFDALWVPVGDASPISPLDPPLPSTEFQFFVTDNAAL